MLRHLTGFVSAAFLILLNLPAQNELPLEIQKRHPRSCSILEVAKPNSTYQGRSWTNGAIPYDFNANVTAAQKLAMQKAMNEIQRIAKINFIRHTNETDWIIIQNSNQNSSNVGRIGGQQTINIYNWNYRFIMAHELIHALGFWHEQQRPDRNTYVTIDFKNIQNGQAHNFNIPARVVGWDSYDFDSVMHYGQFAFAIDPKKPTIIVKPPNQGWQNKIGQRTHLSFGDIKGIRAVYGKNLKDLTTRVSISSAGKEGNSYSQFSSISADGRYVAFQSVANNLVSNDTNINDDIFVRDRKTKTTTRVSISSAGKQGNSDSWRPSISSLGRYVAFESLADNLVSNDTNGTWDIFVRDRKTKTTTRVSISSAGKQGNGSSYSPSISADGRYVAFASLANNLVSNDTNNSRDIFVHDRKTKTTTRVSISSAGKQGNGYFPSISSLGRYVAFFSDDSNLVLNDTNNYGDIFVHDRKTKTTTRVSISSAGKQGNGVSVFPSISSLGRYVAFASWANNLVSNDTNNSRDIFVHDCQNKTTTRVSISSAGKQGNNHSAYPSISSLGRYVAFVSSANNLVSNDTNNSWDIFVHDCQTKTTTRVSISSAGKQGNANSWYPNISANGRYVAFESLANSLVSNDINGVSDIFVRDMQNYHPPGIISFGSACLGSLGLPRLFTDAESKVGNDAFAFKIENAKKSAPVLVLVSASSSSLKIGGGCTLYVALPAFPIIGISDLSGMANLPLPIPIAIWLKDVTFYAQGVVLDSKGAWLNKAAFTQGLKVVITK